MPASSPPSPPSASAGGQETYGQTVGLSLQPETFWWAILGFVIKGAAWGLLGGAFIGIALDRQRYTATQLLAGFAIMIFGTWLGWQYLNNPKLIYFSNRLDRPREELWAGLWLGGLLLLAWLRSRVPSICALRCDRRGDRLWRRRIAPANRRSDLGQHAARLVEGDGADVRRAAWTRLCPVRVASP